MGGALVRVRGARSLPADIRLQNAERLAVLAVVCHLAACGLPDTGTGQSAPGNEGESLKLAVSDSAVPLMNLFAREVTEVDSGMKLEFLPETHSAGAAAATHLGDSDIGVLTRGLRPEEESFGLKYLHMARDGLVFATHKGVTVDDITSDEVRAIYSGRITNWKDLGGRDQEIVVLDRPEHTSAKILLRTLLFGDDMRILDDAMVLERPAMMNVSLANVESSIGYTSLGEIVSNSLDIHVLSLDGTPPTLENVAHNVYPLARFIGLVIKTPPSRRVMRFVEFVYSTGGRDVMTANGYSPALLNLVIATIPERNVLRQDSRYRPLVEYLSSQLGSRTQVRLQHLPSYEILVDEFATGMANAAFFGSLTYALTRARVEVEPVARPEKDGMSWYRGLIFVRKDSNIREWRDLEGKSFSMIRDTTAGDIFPKVYLKRHGIRDADAFFGEIVLAGSHDTSVLKVLNREVDAGAAKDLVFRQMAAEDSRIDDELEILAESLPVPENAFVVRTNMDTSCFSCHERLDEESTPGSAQELSGRGLIVRLREALLRLDESPEGRQVLKSLGADRFLETTDADYENLYLMVRELGLDLSEY
jgi:phosphate transport system substrate-binding protein